MNKNITETDKQQQVDIGGWFLFVTNPNWFEQIGGF